MPRESDETIPGDLSVLKKTTGRTAMNESDLQNVVETIVTRAKQRAEVFTSATAIMEHSQSDKFDIRGPILSIHRKVFPASYLPALAPLLCIKDDAACKYAIDIIGRMKGASEDASIAITLAWENSWEHGIPQACVEAFRALIRIGNNDHRLLAMTARALQVDNYQVHKECANALVKIDSGDHVLASWSDTIPGKCNCHLHKKLATKIAAYVKSL